MDMITLERLGRGDDVALDRFYEEHVDGLYAFVFYRVGKDPTVAEDVVQETFLDALDHLDAYDPARGSISSWLCVRSRNVIRRHLRSHRRSQELQAMWDRIDETLAQVFAALEREPLTDEVIEREETRDLVNVTIANLPDNYRTVLQSKYIGGETMAQLAQRMQVSEDAAKSLLARARRAFRETFAALSEAATEGAR
jgi:RNA polymerase sigma-70 factor (ECF subfamily)